MSYFLDFMMGLVVVENVIWAARLNKVWNVLFYVLFATVYLCLRINGVLDGYDTK